MACIFGQRSKSEPGTPQEQSEVSTRFKIFLKLLFNIGILYSNLAFDQNNSNMVISITLFYGLSA